METSIEISGRVTRDDIERVYRRQTRGIRWVGLGLLLFLGTVGLTSFFILAQKNVGEALLGSSVMLLPMALILFVFLFTRRKINRQIDEFEKLSIDTDYVFDEEKIQFQSEQAEFFLKWDQIVKVIEWPEDFLLQPVGGISYILPKRLMKSESELDSLRSLFRNKLGKKAKVNP